MNVSLCCLNANNEKCRFVGYFFHFEDFCNWKCEVLP